MIPLTLEEIDELDLGVLEGNGQGRGGTGIVADSHGRDGGWLDR